MVSVHNLGTPASIRLAGCKTLRSKQKHGVASHANGGVPVTYTDRSSNIRVGLTQYMMYRKLGVHMASLGSAAHELTAGRRLMPSLVHRSSEVSAHTRGHALGAPRLYEIMAEVAFFGRRRAAFQALIAAVGVRRGQRVLDVGCGTGYFARLLAEPVGSTGRVVGIDPSQEMIRYATRTAGAARNCQFQVGTTEALAFPAEHFDVVVSRLVMHHLPDDLRVPALREMQRVLRPGGKLLIAEARAPSHGLVLCALSRIHGFDRMARMVPHLEPLALQAGFDEVRAGEVPPWLRYIVALK